MPGCLNRKYTGAFDGVVAAACGTYLGTWSPDLYSAGARRQSGFREILRGFRTTSQYWCDLKQPKEFACLTACIVTFTRCWRAPHGKEADLAEVAANVTQVLADLILMAPADEQAMMIADVMANLGGMLLQKREEDTDPNSPRRRH